MAQEYQLLVPYLLNAFPLVRFYAVDSIIYANFISTADCIQILDFIEPRILLKCGFYYRVDFNTAAI